MDEFDTTDIQYEYERAVPIKPDDSPSPAAAASNANTQQKKQLFKRYSLCNKEKVISLCSEGDEA